MRLRMANRKGPEQTVTDMHVALVEKAVKKHDKKKCEALEAEQDLRVVIRQAFEAGLTAGPIKAASGLSGSRLYQIRDGKRN